MPNTTNYSLPFPQDSDGPDGPGQLQALAEAVDTQLTTVWDELTDTGSVATLGVTMSTGWSLTEKLHRVFLGHLMCLRLAFTRTGAALEGSVNSNVADTDILTITTTALRPQWTCAMHIRFSNCGAGGELASSTGLLKLTDIPNGGDIATGDTGQLSICYPLA